MISSAVRILLFCPFADCPRYPSGPSAFEFSHRRPTETVSGKYCPTQADRPRSFGGPSAVYFCGWELLCRASGEQVPWTADYPPLTRGLSALPNFRQPRIFLIFTISTLNWDHCSNKISKNLKTSMNTIQKLIWVSKNENLKINRVKSRKLINTP